MHCRRGTTERCRLEARLAGLPVHESSTMNTLVFVNERPAPDLQAQPEVELRHWRVLRRGNGALHLAAQMVSGSFRVTSALMAIDLARGIIKTDSGRSYRLCAPPEENELLRGLITLNAARDLVVVSADVSEIVWKAVSSGAWYGAEGSLLPPIQ